VGLGGVTVLHLLGWSTSIMINPVY